MKQDWEHQAELVNEAFSEFESGTRRLCLQLPTGGGKTRILRRIIERFRANGKIIYCVTHRLSLVKQLGRELREAKINFSYILPGFPMINCHVLVCSMMTIVRRFDRMPKPDLIVIDEAHHVRSSSYHKLFEVWPDARILGVTATPQRTDGKPLSNVFNRLICGPSVKYLISGGYLSDFDYFAPMKIDMSGVRTVAGDYARNESVAKVDRRAIIGDVIEHYRRYADHQPAIVSCVSIDHCEHVASQFREADYRAQAIHSRLTSDRVEELLNGLRTGLIEILIQCELLGEGVDIKGASVLIQLRPTQSLVVFLQHIGRVLRFVEGKRAVILDHVGNYELHGLPDDPRAWSLAGCANDKGILLYRRCESCYRPVRKTLAECPYCGYVFEINEREGRSLPQEREGELVNVREIADFELIAQSKEEHKRDCMGKILRAGSLKQAEEIAVAHGYSHRFGWMIWTKVKNKRRIA